VGVNELGYRAAEARLWASEGVAPEARWLELPRHRLRVRVQVAGGGPPVLFVHGAGIAGASWAPLVARLDGWQRLVLDRPGCGLSEPPPAAFADVGAYGAFAESLLIEVLDALDIETASLVSSSLGGYFALRTAAAHPERIDRIIHCGWTVGAPIGKTPVMMRLMSGFPRVGRIMTNLRVSEQMTRTMLRQAGLRDALANGRVSPALIDWWRAMLNDTDTMRNEIAGAPPIMHPVRGVNDSILLPGELLRRVTVPVSFIWGTDDPFGGQQIASPFVAHLPNATLDLMPGGHAVWIDDPDRVAAATRAALAGTRS
jgi:2-hydroxy-6-oxonona-2,4-dienedioate hydrolase